MVSDSKEMHILSLLRIIVCDQNRVRFLPMISHGVGVEL